MNSSGKFTIAPTQLESVIAVEPKVLDDESNWFVESFNARYLSGAIGLDIKFVQDNQLFSKQWVGIELRAENH